MENQKLEVILEIMEDIDNAKSRDLLIDKLDHLTSINARCFSIMSNYSKHNTFAKIIGYLSIECTLESEEELRKNKN